MAPIGLNGSGGYSRLSLSSPNQGLNQFNEPRTVHISTYGYGDGDAMESPRAGGDMCGLRAFARDATAHVRCSDLLFTPTRLSVASIVLAVAEITAVVWLLVRHGGTTSATSVWWPSGDMLRMLMVIGFIFYPRSIQERRMVPRS